MEPSYSGVLKSTKSFIKGSQKKEHSIASLKSIFKSRNSPTLMNEAELQQHVDAQEEARKATMINNKSFIEGSRRTEHSMLSLKSTYLPTLMNQEELELNAAAYKEARKDTLIMCDSEHPCKSPHDSEVQSGRDSGVSTAASSEPKDIEVDRFELHNPSTWKDIEVDTIHHSPNHEQSIKRRKIHTNSM